MKNMNLVALELAITHIRILTGDNCQKCPCTVNNIRYCHGPNCAEEVLKHLLNQAKNFRFHSLMEKKESHDIKN